MTFFCKADGRLSGVEREAKRTMGFRELAHKSPTERLDSGCPNSRPAAFLII